MHSNAYRIRCQFNAVHSLDITNPEKMHAHTFRVTAYIENVGEELHKIDKCDQLLKEYFSKYKGLHINDVSPFQTVLPTIENMCQVFYEDLTKKLLQEGVRLVKLELGDSPITSYSVGCVLLAGSAYNRISDEQYREYSQRVWERN